MDLESEEGLFLFLMDWMSFCSPADRIMGLVALDGTVHTIDLLNLKELCIAVMKQEERLITERRGIYCINLDGPMACALLSFLDNPKKESIVGSSFSLSNTLLQFGYKYELDNLINAAGEVFIDKIEGNEWKDEENLWELHTWIVSKTDMNNGEIPPVLIPLKVAITKFFRK
ncbi:unnamed protein product [Orchesella dallaii]|uniref:Uncharacterized protein n=1 Tax=Orchesella dallaii TaxID=48710 RepID=A0ABP1RME6_9HEXA